MGLFAYNKVLHPMRTTRRAVTRSVTPKPVRKLRRGVISAHNPVATVEGAAKARVSRSVSRAGRRSGRGQGGGGVALGMVVVLGLAVAYWRVLLIIVALTAAVATVVLILVAIALLVRRRRERRRIELDNAAIAASPGVRLLLGEPRHVNAGPSAVDACPSCGDRTGSSHDRFCRLCGARLTH